MSNIDSIPDLMSYIKILIHSYIARCSFDINESNKISYMPLKLMSFDLDLHIHCSLLFVKYELSEILSMNYLQ